MDILYRIADWDKELFLYINSHHIAWLDPVMLALSSFTSWIIICIAIIAFMVYKGGRWKYAAPFFMLLTIGLNSLLNHIVKQFVARPRPVNVEAWEGVIHALEEASATSFSFYSAHSSNSFSMAVFSLLFFRNKKYSWVILIWATLVAYSRIYVGKHYPVDIMVGTLFGIMMGFLCYKLFDIYKERKLRTDNL